MRSPTRYVEVALEVSAPEARRIVRALAVVLVASLGLGVLKAAQSGLFLASCPRARIPEAFFASAVCLALVSSLVVALAPRASPSALTRGCLAVSAAVVAVAHLALALGLPEAPFALYAAAEAASGVLIVQIWAVVSQAIDVRTGKRVLPIAGVVSSVAWALCGLVVPLSTRVFGTRALLALAAMLFVIAAALVDPAPASERREAPSLVSGLTSGFAFLLRDPLARLLTTLAVLSMVLEQTMDFALLSAARELFVGDAAIASFFSRFYAVTSAISILTLAGAAGRVLSRLGGVRALALMPLAVAIVAGVGVALPTFTLVVAYRGVGRVLKQAVWSASTEQLQSPLPATRKTQARQATRGVIAPLGYGVGSLALAALPAHVSIASLATITCALALVISLVVLTRVGPRYVDALRRAIDDRSFSLAPPRAFAGHTIERDALAALEADLASRDESRALAALELLAVVPDPPLAAIEAATEHPSARVRDAALGHALAFDPGRALVRAVRVAREDVAPDNRLRAIDRLLELTTQGYRMPSLGIARGAEPVARWAELAEHAGDDAFLATRLATAIDGEDALAARALLLVRPTNAHGPGIVGAIDRRLASGSTETRIAASEAVIRAGIVVLVPTVVEQLEDRALGPLVAKVVVRLAPTIPGASAPPIDGTLSRLASRITRVADAASIDALVARLLVHPRPAIRQHATRALASAIARGERAALPAERVLVVLESDARRAYHLTALAQDVQARMEHAAPDARPPLEALAFEIGRTLDGARSELLPIVALLGHAELVSAVEAGRRRPSPGRDAQIAELLEASLPEPLRAMVVPLFDRLSYGRVASRGRTLALAPPDDAPLDVLLAPFGDPCFVRLVNHVLRPEAHGEAPMHALFDRLRLLRTVPLFRDLPTDEAFALAERLEPVAVPAHTVIFRKDEPGDALYVVVEGTCTMQTDGRPVASFGRGEFFGELSLLDGEPRSTDAVASTEASLLRLRAQDFDEILVHRPDAIRGVVRVLAARLRAATRASPTERA